MWRWRRGLGEIRKGGAMTDWERGERLGRVGQESGRDLEKFKVTKGIGDGGKLGKIEREGERLGRPRF